MAWRERNVAPEYCQSTQRSVRCNCEYRNRVRFGTVRILLAHLVPSHSEQVTTKLRPFVDTTATQRGYRCHSQWYLRKRAGILRAGIATGSMLLNVGRRLDNDLVCHSQPGQMDRLPGILIPENHRAEAF